MPAPEQNHVEIETERDIVIARKSGREMAKSVGFRALDCTQIATVISELARNIFLYAARGAMTISSDSEHGRVVGVGVIAHDTGPGIQDVGVAMRDGYSTSNGLGLGLPGAKRLMDEFELKSEPGVGTTVTVRKWLAK